MLEKTKNETEQGISGLPGGGQKLFNRFIENFVYDNGSWAPY